PELIGVHLAEPFVALDGKPLFSPFEDMLNDAGRGRILLLSLRIRDPIRGFSETDLLRGEVPQFPELRRVDQRFIDLKRMGGAVFLNFPFDPMRRVLFVPLDGRPDGGGWI